MRAKYFLHSIKAGKHTNTAFNIIHNNTSRSFIVSFAWRNLSDSWTLKINWRKGEGAFSSRPRRNKGFYFLSYKLSVQNIICSIWLKIAPNRKSKKPTFTHRKKITKRSFDVVSLILHNRRVSLSFDETEIVVTPWLHVDQIASRLRHIKKWNLTI